MYVVRKQILAFLCVLILVISALPCFQLQVKAEEDVLDLSQMQIILPADATDVEQTAAKELCTYLQKITDSVFSVAVEGEHTGAGIYIGATNYAQAKGVSYPTEGDENGEAWAIKAVDGNLVLCGAPTRGTLYAVYHLLEDVLGVHWWNLWEEYIPKGDAIVPADYSNSGVPVMEYREVFVGNETTSDYPFYVRNRMNGSHINAIKSYGGEEAYGLPAHVHTFDRYFPATFNTSNTWLASISSGGDFATNPEWYSLGEDGNRNTDQLCLTNESLQQEFATRLVKNIAYCYADADRSGIKRPSYFAIVPNDNARSCQCTNCQNEINTYGLSGYVLRFVNQMAKAVTEAGYTDAVVEMLVYWTYMDPPTGGVVPAENVQIRFADNWTDLLHGLDHANNTEEMARLQTWLEITKGNLYYWQYVVNYTNNGIFPSMFHYGDDITTLANMGVDGWFAEQEQCINVDFWDMKLWLITKLMEKPVSGEEYTALMDEFIYGYYGEAAGTYIRQYLYYMHEKAEATTIDQNYGTNIIGAEWLTVQDIIQANFYFEQALAAAGEDDILLRRIHNARNGLDRVIVENFERWADEAKEAGLTIPFAKWEVGERVYATLTEQIEFRGSYDIDYERIYNRYDRYADILPELPSEFDHIAREHILDYVAIDFRLAYDYCVVSDAKSITGKAIRCDAASRLAQGSEALLFSNGNRINFSFYDDGAPEAYRYVQIGEIMPEDIQTDGTYHLYSFQWTIPEMSDSAYVYLFGDWGVQNPAVTKDFQLIAGQTVNIYISMRVTGTVDGSDPNDYPVYYIDRMIVVPEQNQWEHDYVTDSISANSERCRTVCTICGKVRNESHTWSPAVVTQKATTKSEGEITQQCYICGCTKTDTLEKLPKGQGMSNVDVLVISSAAFLSVTLVALALIILKRRK